MIVLFEVSIPATHLVLFFHLLIGSAIGAGISMQTTNEDTIVARYVTPSVLALFWFPILALLFFLALSYVLLDGVFRADAKEEP